mmetsp:Transcript_21505/g.45022  ORF Transcript_21505/g.45022 Transcript_21505/m.45022 type:complete len:89 (-) Transcript_21505:109-375(-)
MHHHNARAVVWTIWCVWVVFVFCIVESPKKGRGFDVQKLQWSNYAIALPKLKERECIQNYLEFVLSNMKMIKCISFKPIIYMVLPTFI